MTNMDTQESGDKRERGSGFVSRKHQRWIVGALAVLALILIGAFTLREDRPPAYRADHTRPAATTSAGDGPLRATYVPVYSHIYHDGGKPHLLEVTLSIRNLETRRSLRVESVDYYDTSGKFLRSSISAPVEIGPLGTAEYLIPQADIAGGSGANFIVTWTPPRPDSRGPLIQAVMVGRDGDRSFSFVCTGVPLDEPPGATGDG